MAKLIIEIPQGLTPQQEIFAIAKALNKKQLIGGKPPKALGSGFVIEDLETNITIKRVSKERPLITVKCTVCECLYQKGKGKSLHTNYGGLNRKLSYCSDVCADVVSSLFDGERISTKKTRPAYLYL